VELLARCSDTCRRAKERRHHHPFPQKFTELVKEHNPKAGATQVFLLPLPTLPPQDTGAVFLPL
jgi:hypothetical protein